MEKNNKDGLPENSEPVEKQPLISTKKLNNGGANSSYPQEYEEQVSPDIRMKPQPFTEPKKDEERK